MRRRFSFFLVILAILGSGTTYIAVRLANHWTYELLTVALLALPLFLFFDPRRNRKEPRTHFGRLLQQAGFVSLGLLSWLCVVALARDAVFLLLLAVGPYESAARFETATGGAPAYSLALAIAAFGAWRALRGPRVRSVRVPIAGLPAELDGFRIVQISDLHVGPTIGSRYVADLVRAVIALEPDLTALTGDIFDGTVADLARSAEPLAGLAPKGRVFYVPGNHEYYHSFAAWRPELDRLGFTTLLNRGEEFRHEGTRVWVGGVPDPAGDAPDPRLAAQGSTESAFRLLLSHRPSYVEAAAAAGFHLQLSGHTHAGQFFPWTLVVGFFHRFFKGLDRHETLWIYVSPGTGTWGPPIRLGTTPEITCLDLASA